MSKETKYNEFEALKNVWKQHYAEIKALKTEHKNAVRSTKIIRALQSVEASLSRLRLTFDEINSQAPSNSSIADSNPDVVSGNQQDSTIRNVKAKESLEIIKNEMGLISEEINKRARARNTTKTIGRQ